MVYFFPRASHQAVADFHRLRHDPRAPLPRQRRRAAARAAWSAVTRQAGETWQQFWQACQAARG